MATDTDVVRLRKLSRIGVTAADIRTWARAEGLAVGDRGRLSPDLIDAYVKAHPRKEILPPALPRRGRRERRMLVVEERQCDWILTDHAKERAAELGISLQQIMDVLERPEVTYEQASYGDGEAIYQREGIALGVNTVTKAVKTVLLRRVETWDHYDVVRDAPFRAS